jgi:3-phosphoshikimate 1-carboxyvinyltransferase
MKNTRFKDVPVKISGKVMLPASKSISNRVLIIRALCAMPFMIRNLSDADDTMLLQSLFQSGEKELYVKNAGTVARFLLAYYASRESDVILKGSERMNDRPVGDLVAALKTMGAQIEYLEKEDHLPVHIYGKTLKGGHIEIPADVSSQFISALLLIAPTLAEGLTIVLKGQIVSKPYIDLTLKLMAGFGIYYQFNENRISVPPQAYRPETFFVESDWSSASYFFAIAALFPGSELEFDHLFEKSWQGDSIITELIQKFGCAVTYAEKACRIVSNKTPDAHFKFDFINYPDLVPTFVCLCCAMQISFDITGTKTLQFKESNRAEVLRTELQKAGYILKVAENRMTYDGSKSDIPEGDIIFDPWNDHRMAMSFAILAAKNRNIVIQNPEVVEKSFPGFWDELSKSGLGINTENLN